MMTPKSSAPLPISASEHSESPLEQLRKRWQGREESVSGLIALVKADLQRRFEEGQRPAVASYLDALPELGEDPDRVLSLLYEEYCLLEEAGEAPDPDSFCGRYPAWQDSLLSQLNYHRVLSLAAGGTPRAPRFPEPGEQFLSFRLRSILGQGGAARVFLAENEQLGGRPNALKISTDRGEEPSIMGRLQHRHIMEVHHVVYDRETGLRGLCMPYLPGRPLDQILLRMRSTPPTKRTAGDLLDAVALDDHPVDLDHPGWSGFPDDSYADACAWLASLLAEALSHAHAREILHRDVKPANILVSCASGPQLLDFNLAHDPHAPERAESALRGGTLPYMAPEQLRAFLDPERWDDVGPTADLYALGLVLRELLTGSRPEAPPAEIPLPRTINELLDVRLEGWPSTRIDNPRVPHALDAVIRRCLAFDPADRYPSAAALAEDLRAVTRRQPLVHATNPDRRERVGFWLTRNRSSLALGTAGGAALLLIGSLVHALGSPTPPPPPDVPPPVAAQDVPALVEQYREEGRMLYDRSCSLTHPEEDRLKFRERARDAFRKALELDPDDFKSHNGLSMIAEGEGDLEARDRALDAAIEVYNRLDQAESLAGGDDRSVRKYRSYAAQLYTKRFLDQNLRFRSILAQNKIQSAEARAEAENLRRLLPDSETAFRYFDECTYEEVPLEKRLGVYWAAAFAHLVLFVQSEAEAEKLELLGRLDSIIGLAQRELDHAEAEPHPVGQTDLAVQTLADIRGLRDLARFWEARPGMAE